MHFYWHICSKELLLILCSVSVTQLQSSEERPCPGERVTFTCTVPSLAHWWNVPSLNTAQSLLPASQQDGVISNPPFEFNVTEVRIGTSIASTATVNVTANLNGTLILCQDGIGVLPDQSTTIKPSRGNVLVVSKLWSVKSAGIFLLCLHYTYTVHTIMSYLQVMLAMLDQDHACSSSPSC